MLMGPQPSRTIFQGLLESVGGGGRGKSAKIVSPPLPLEDASVRARAPIGFQPLMIWVVSDASPT